MSIPRSPRDWPTTLQLPPDASAPRCARRYVQRQANELPDDLVADAMLIVSELVANAVMHGRPEIWLHVRSTPSGIALGVQDAGEALPPTTVPLDGLPDGLHGRGLRIVAALASTWGVQPTSEGKLVWFELHAVPSERQPHLGPPPC